MIGLCCVMGLISCASKTRMYERYVQDAYDALGHERPGYATLSLEFLDALDADLEACYSKKRVDP